MTVKNAIFLLLAGLFLLTENTAYAGSYWPSTEAEFAKLPPYCKARVAKGKGLKMSDAEIQKWKNALGPGFIHVHHLCAALNYNILRPGSTDKPGLRVVMKDIEYVQKKAPKDFPLHPLLSLERGKILLRLDQPVEAIMEFQKAIAVKPSYTPPYAALGDYYTESGQTDKAIDILEKGLKHSPKSRRLKRRLSKLKPAEE